MGLLTVAALAATGASPSQAVRKAASNAAFDRMVKGAEEARAAGRLADAAGQYREALALRPDWVEGHWALATVLYDLDAYEEAREHFRRVIAARPQDGTALALKALCDVRLKDYDAAFDDLKRARVLGVPNAEVRAVAAFQLALLVNRSGATEMAAEMLRGLAVQGKDSPNVIEAFGLTTLRLPLMPDEVPAEKKEMLRLAGRGGYHMARGRRTAVGRMAFEELVSRYPSEPNVHYAFGAYIAPEEPDAAIAELRKELARDPSHYQALLQIASVEAKRGNAERALAPAEEAARLAPNVPAAHLILGRALLEVGDTARAVQELEKGAALAPESADIQFALARAYKRAGREEDAEKARQEFLRLDRAAREKDGKTPSDEPPETPPGPSQQDGG
jgi:tetratricopeptide (TPR) repeat protein